VLRFFPDDATALSALERGEVDGIREVQPRELARAAGIQSLSLYTATLPDVTWVVLNTADPLLGDAAVRKALALAVDRADLIGEALAGRGAPVYGPIPCESWAYSPIVEATGFDIKGAASALDAAGWTLQPDGTRVKESTVLEVTLTYLDDPTMRVVADILTKQWQAVGIRVKADPASSATFADERLRPRTFQAALYRWTDVAPDPDMYPYFHSTQTKADGQNYSQFNVRAADEALEEARLTSDPARRKELYSQFQKIFADQVPAIFLYRSVYTMGVSDKVYGVQIGPLLAPSDRFASFAGWYVMEKRVIAAEATGTRVATAP
jgi:peptide/nickel transport system substrate-binding protein